MKSIDRFEILGTLGVGTVGTVYDVRDPDDGREYALKMLLPSVSENEQIAARFAREIGILQRLRHPNIIQHHADGRIDKQLYYVMEKVDAGNVKDVLRRLGRLPWPQVVQCGWQTSSALQYAHNHGIVHRDLKPSNLFLTADGAAKLGDFGIALDIHNADLTADGLTVGTFNYMSPEQIKGSRGITGKTDLYALGCVLFEMTTGRPPYPGDNFAQIFDQHLHADPPSARALAPDCPEELDALIRQLLAKDPEQRPFSARAVQGRLAGIMEPAAGDEGDEAGTAVAANLQRIDMQRIGRLSPADQTTAPIWAWLLGAAVIAALIAAAKFSS